MAPVIDHPKLGRLIRVEASTPGEPSIGVPAVQNNAGGTNLRPLARGELMSPGARRAWDAHLAADLPTTAVRSLSEIETAAGPATAPFALTFAEARRLAAMLQARLPTLAEIERILARLTRDTPLDLPADRHLPVWTTDLATCLDGVFARVVAESGFAALSARPGELARDHPFLLTDKRRTVTFHPTSDRNRTEHAETDQLAAWLVRDLPGAETPGPGPDGAGG